MQGEIIGIRRLTRWMKGSNDTRLKFLPSVSLYVISLGSFLSVTPVFLHLLSTTIFYVKILIFSIVDLYVSCLQTISMCHCWVQWIIQLLPGLRSLGHQRSQVIK